MGQIRLFRGHEIEIINARFTGFYSYNGATRHPNKLTVSAFGTGDQMKVTLKGDFKIDRLGSVSGDVNKVIARDAVTGQTIYSIAKVGLTLSEYDSANFYQVLPIFLSSGGLRLSASSNNDTITGTALRDVVKLGGGTDTVSMLAGNDKAFGGRGNDSLDGGEGHDTLLGGDGNDTLIGAAGDDRLIGGRGNDALDGGAGLDTLLGGDGNDTLTGAAGDDRLIGGKGQDVLDGGEDRDVFTGGKHADTFVFSAVSETGNTKDTRDVITDFGTGGDKIDLSAMDANAGEAGDQTFTFIGSAEFSGTAGELRFTARKKLTVVEGDVDGDGVADFQIGLTGRHVLYAGDFIL